MRFKARDEELLFQAVGDDLIIYDMKRHLYLHLNPTAALVWKNCDGRNDVAELTTLVRRVISSDANEETVWSALSRLSEADLLEGDFTAETESRRAFLQRTALRGGAALVAATISILIAPAPAHAQSTCATSDFGLEDCTCQCQCW
jgi:hypothetical protein